ncbi:sodium/hydrogen exchanger [Pluteus cervinus]|uniref:Sodium/hydrogen exchanger n=1 Tax=Pluteus cervinus TaxID=181527 RepID=A0ACD3AZE4_9AGAR|nr:sodium/hydrogen exchanger [Pluteus cervinus]
MSIHLGSLTTTAGALASTPTGGAVPEEEEYYSSWSLFLVCVLLILSLLTSYYLQIKRIRAVHETLVSIFAGMFVGLIVRLAPGTMIREMLTFKHTLFFNLLLPPIILNSGYELKQENFFRNFGSILTFAFLGTFVSAVGVGILVYIYSMLGLESFDPTLIECLIFGSTLSATDPVTILAIFNQYKVDPKLYSIIFGESLLNDAVSIVMTLSQFHGTEMYVGSLFHAIGLFLVNFSVSMALGVAFGLGMSLLLKHSSLNYYPSIETCLVALCAYTCYFFSTGLTMSGIVSLLFCGITLKHYAYHTMSRRTQRATKYIFSTLAQLSENFIFIYLGLSLFTSAPVSEAVFNYVKPVFITITLVAVVFTRYAAVFPLSEVINFFHKHARGQRTEELPHSYQMMLFWAGLRGAVGVALAAGFKGPNAQIMRTTVLVVVVLTVLLFGGTTARMLEILGIRTGVEDDAASDSDDEELYGGGYGRRLSNAGASGGGRGGWMRYSDDETSYLAPQDRENRDRRAASIGSHYALRGYNPNQHVSRPSNHGIAGIFSTGSSDSFDSDDVGEVLPMAPTAQHTLNSPPPQQQSHPSHSRGASVVDLQQGGAVGGVGSGIPPRRSSGGVTIEDRKWFQTLDEQYLLPLFSNATASRTFHARRARRSHPSGTVGVGAGVGVNLDSSRHGSRGGSMVGTPVESGDEGDGTEIDLGGRLQQQQQQMQNHQLQQLQRFEGSRTERGLPSPVLRGNSNGSGAGGDGAADIGR